MVLRINLLTLLFIGFFIQANANLGKLTYTDSYDVNYFTNSTSLSENRIFFGSDLFRFLNSEQLSQSAIFIQGFLEDMGNKKESQFQLDQKNVVSTTLTIPTNKLLSLGYNWKKDYLIEWEKLIGGFDIQEQVDNVRNAENAFYQCDLAIEQRSMFNAFNLTTKLEIAIVLKHAMQFPEDLTMSVSNKLFKKGNSIEYNEIVYNANLNALQKTFCGPTANEATANVLILQMAEYLFANSALQPDLQYGVNKTVFHLRRNTNELELLSLSDLKRITEKDLNAAKKAVLQDLTQQVSLDKMFYFKHLDLLELPKIMSNISLESYVAYLDTLESAHFVYSLPSENFMLSDSTVLYPADHGILKAPLLMKKNASIFSHPSDSIVLDKMSLFLSLNPDVVVSLNGIANSNEYTRITKEQRRNVIAPYKESVPGFKVSRKMNLSLLRSISVYNYITQTHSKPYNIRCVGTLIKNDPDIAGMVKIEHIGE